MTIINEYFERLKSFKIDDIWKAVFDDKVVKETIIRLNTEEQLFKKSIDSEGKPLFSQRTKRGTYSPVTELLSEGKKKAGDPYTLKKDGDFYESFTVTVAQNFILIDADPFKEDVNLFEDFGVDVLGLTEESIEILNELLIPRVRREFLEWLTRV